jgi:hypothetical protein
MRKAITVYNRVLNFMFPRSRVGCILWFFIGVQLNHIEEIVKVIKSILSLV